MDQISPSDPAPLDRETLLGNARRDLAYANDNKITYQVIAEYINQALGTKWDKGAVRRFVRFPDGVRGAVHGNSLLPQQVSVLAQLASHIRQDVDRGFRVPFTLPLITNFTEAAREIVIPLSAEQAKLLQDDPKLSAILEATLQITAKQVLQAYRAGQDDQPSPETPEVK
jgi:hypothetical protein